MAVQLRHCPVPAVARPFRLLALQQREGIAPIVGAGHRRADYLHQPGVGRGAPDPAGCPIPPAPPTDTVRPLRGASRYQV